MGVQRRVTEIDATIGRNLRHLRTISELSQEYLAEETGVSNQQLQKYERGQNRISSAYLYKCSQVLEVSINEFFTGLKVVPEPKSSFEQIGQRVLEDDALQILDCYHLLNTKQKKNLKTILKLLAQNG